MDWEEALQKGRAVKVGFFGHPTAIVTCAPAGPAAIASVSETSDYDFVPAQYLSFLGHSDGAFMLPWDEDGVAGVELFSTDQIEDGHELAEATATGDDPRYFVVGQLRSAASDFIAVDAAGAVWWLAQGCGPGDWERGSGIKRISDSLIEFVSKLADAKGAWWWLKGFESDEA